MDCICLRYFDVSHLSPVGEPRELSIALLFDTACLCAVIPEWTAQSTVALRIRTVRAYKYKIYNLQYTGAADNLVQPVLCSVILYT